MKRTAPAWLSALALPACLALVPAGARAAATTASLSVSATVVRGDEKAKGALPAARPPPAPAGAGAAPAALPPPGSLVLRASGESRSSAARWPR